MYILGVVNSAADGGFPLQMSLPVTPKHVSYYDDCNGWRPSVSEDVMIDLGVRCMHVLLSDRVVVWSEKWNMLKVDRGVLVVGRMEDEALSETAVFAVGEWRQCYEAWSRGDHEIEAQVEGVF